MYYTMLKGQQEQKFILAKEFFVVYLRYISDMLGSHGTGSVL